MKINDQLTCPANCEDVKIIKHFSPVNCDSSKVRLVMISEALPENLDDYFYGKGSPFFIQTTNQAFTDAGFHFTAAQDYLNHGIYLTAAIKCKKKDDRGGH